MEIAMFECNKYIIKCHKITSLIAITKYSAFICFYIYTFHKTTYCLIVYFLIFCLFLSHDKFWMPGILHCLSEPRVPGSLHIY